jgi:1,3-beta-glucan synthase
MSMFNNSFDSMEFQDAQKFVIRSVNEITSRFQKVPGSAMLIRYIRSSYQDDPVRSAIELVLVIFFVRYLLSPSYSTKDGNFVKLTEEVSCSVSQWDGIRRVGKGVELTSGQEIDDLVDEWTPEPLVAPLTAFEDAENEKTPVIVGFVLLRP